MRPLDIGLARAQAHAAITQLADDQRLGQLIIVDAAIVETPDAWYFPYDSAACVLRGDVSSALAGNIPVRVARDGSGVRFAEPDTT